jgi:TolB-like protein/Flp pilus assembly protein TadD
LELVVATEATSVSPPTEEIRAQLARILASRIFAGSHRSQRFLSYVVEKSFDPGSDGLKEYTIAVDVFERNASYDSSIDATVRVEAGRLRSRLHEYYAEDGKQDCLIIDIPKGGYRATFSQRTVTGVTQVAPPAPPPTPTAEPRHRDRRWILRWSVAGVCALAIVLWATLRHHREAKPTPPAKAAHVLAVLPFANRTGSPANNYITDGLTDNLIRQLSELPHLKVISRTAVDHTPPSVLTQFGVTTLLRGELRRNTDGQLVLNSELSNAKDGGAVLLSRQYMPDSDLQSVQADIVQDVIKGLGMELDERQSADAQRPLTSSQGAFQSFLRGESAAREQNAQGLHASIRNYEDAIRQDTDFALAYSSLAASHTLLGLYFEPAREQMPLARRYAEHALALDPSLVEAHGMLGLIHLVYDWDYTAAQSELTAADARDVAISALTCTAHLLGTSGHLRHAEEDLHRMLEFDPQSPALIGELGCVNYYGGRYDEAVRYYRNALAEDPRSVIANWGLGRSLGSEGHYSEALVALRRFKTMNGFEPPVITAEIGYAEGASGDRKAAIETADMLQRAAAHTFVDPYLVALIYLSLKDADNTYAWLNKAYADRSSFLISIATDPKWTASRQDARFQDLLGRMTDHAGR